MTFSERRSKPSVTTALRSFEIGNDLSFTMACDDAEGRFVGHSPVDDEVFRVPARLSAASRRSSTVSRCARRAPPCASS